MTEHPESSGNATGHLTVGESRLLELIESEMVKRGVNYPPDLTDTIIHDIIHFIRKVAPFEDHFIILDEYWHVIMAGAAYDYYVEPEDIHEMNIYLLAGIRDFLTRKKGTNDDKMIEKKKKKLYVTMK